MDTVDTAKQNPSPVTTSSFKEVQEIQGKFNKELEKIYTSFMDELEEIVEKNFQILKSLEEEKSGRTK